MRLLPIALLFLSHASAQQTGTVRGVVTLEASGDPLHHATVTVSRTGRVGETGEDGKYEITGVAPGSVGGGALVGAAVIGVRAYRAACPATRRARVRIGQRCRSYTAAST